MGRVPGMILPAMNVIELIWDNILVLILIISNLMISCSGFLHKYLTSQTIGKVLNLVNTTDKLTNMRVGFGRVEVTI